MLLTINKATLLRFRDCLVPVYLFSAEIEVTSSVMSVYQMLLGDVLWRECITIYLWY